MTMPREGEIKEGTPTALILQDLDIVKGVLDVGAREHLTEGFFFVLSLFWLLKNRKIGLRRSSTLGKGR